jgi:methyl-accepting chemotaxis protein
VIEASIDQQFSGVDQVASAMNNIAQAVRQNLDGTTQLKEAAERLSGLGLDLKSLVDRYRV